ncbi:hypothetical protein N7530_000469 [Penicillium desertorum]|uniref:Uncharacterized protein n=1 Tax=Penicillium desertorum TaxID=1303715 RepID=A0A9W9X8Q2_9EURO|nr:hypothetical protein N7530_000469 [Penicillium desertorum]
MVDPVALDILATSNFCSLIVNGDAVSVAVERMVTAVAAYTIFGSDILPAQADPTGDPENWTMDEMRRWLQARGLLPNEAATREELLERVKANLRIPRKTSAGP